MRLSYFVTGLVLLGLTACSASGDMDKAEAAVAHLHQQLNAGQYQAIYDASDEQFKKAVSGPDLVRMLDGVHAKLGDFKSGRRSNWRVNYGIGGEYVTLDYQSEFANGQAVEDFVFHIVGDAPILVGYHINSNALLGSDANTPRQT